MKLDGSRVRTAELVKGILHSIKYPGQCINWVELAARGQSQLRDGLGWSTDGGQCASLVFIWFHFCLSIFL